MRTPVEVTGFCNAGEHVVTSCHLEPMKNGGVSPGHVPDPLLMDLRVMFHAERHHIFCHVISACSAGSHMVRMARRQEATKAGERSDNREEFLINYPRTFLEAVHPSVPFHGSAAICASGGESSAGPRKNIDL